MADLHSPEHPEFPRNAEALRDPQREPTAHEKYILSVFLRFRELPDFEKLAPPSRQKRDEAVGRLNALLQVPPDLVGDQDERVLHLAALVADYPELFGRVGYALVAEIMAACKTIETSEFRRAFVKEYEVALPSLRHYLREVANLRRRGKQARYTHDSVPPQNWGSNERRAAAREQMELVQTFPDHQLMEKYWRTLEIVCSFPDLFSREQYEKLVANTGVEKTWRAHMAKARDDWNYYKHVQKSAVVLRQVVDQAVALLKEIVTRQFPDAFYDLPENQT